MTPITRLYSSQLPPNSYYLAHPVNFPSGRKPEHPEKTHDFQQSVELYNSFHTRTWFESRVKDEWSTGLTSTMLPRTDVRGKRPEVGPRQNEYNMKTSRICNGSGNFFCSVNNVYMSAETNVQKNSGLLLKLFPDADLTRVASSKATH